MKKVYSSDWYYIRSKDLKVVPYGVFKDTDEGRQEAFDAADDHAEGTGHEALIYLSSGDLLDLMDDLQRAFDATHPD
jgi:hypothetical protein